MRKLSLVAFALCLAAASRAQTFDDLSNPRAFLKSAAVLAVPAAVAAPAGQPAGGPQLPSHFDIDEKVLSWTTSLTIKDGSRKLGEVTERLLAWGKTFDYKDAQGNAVAVARAKVLSWGTDIFIEDAQGRRIGEMKENVMKSIFKVTTEYSIMDGQGRQVLRSDKTDWISTDFKLYDMSGKLVASMHRPWLNVWSDHWTADVYNAAAIDSRVLVMIAAYKTAVDNDRRSEDSHKSSSK